MKAVILVAGEGTRMRPLTTTRPKVMLPIANKSILEHIVDASVDAGINEFVFITGYFRDSIKEHFKDGKKWGRDIKIKYVHQAQQRGTADAIGCARDYVDGRFVVLNGDVLISSDYLKNLILRDGDAVLTVKEVEDPSNFGVIETKGGKVTKIMEKPEDPPTNLANAGIYLFADSIFDFIDKTTLSGRGELEITDSLQMMIDSGADVGYNILEHNWIDVGRPWDMLYANELLLQDIKANCHGLVEPNATLIGEVVVGEGTLIRNGAYIIGPVVIGNDCDIGPNCFIRPATSIGNGVRIGNAVEVKNSIIMDNTNIGHLSYVGDSIIGQNCNLGAGTKVANLRHDGKTIRVTLGCKFLDSGRRKLGVIMGDGVHTAINTSINVGSVIESGGFTKPGEVVR
ncbi:MAG TPA: glucose-1-phosphate thymidylyltransferase [Methanosarcinaceae archaeon]|nr:glucose-1-phosphate thymidylyltransferase [Methanosarcinaceae archaeon]